MNKLTIKIPPGVAKPSRIECFHDGMNLDWDQVTNIYEDEKRIHFIVFDYTDVTTKQMFQKLLELGFLDFGFHIILKSIYIAIWYFPGRAKEFKEHYLKNTQELSWNVFSEWLTNSCLIKSC